MVKYFKASYFYCNVAKKDEQRGRLLQQLCFDCNKNAPIVIDYQMDELKLKKILKDKELIKEINVEDTNTFGIIYYKYYISKNDIELHSSLFEGL